MNCAEDGENGTQYVRITARVCASNITAARRRACRAAFLPGYPHAHRPPARQGASFSSEFAGNPPWPLSVSGAAELVQRGSVPVQQEHVPLRQGAVQRAGVQPEVEPAQAVQARPHLPQPPQAIRCRHFP